MNKQRPVNLNLTTIKFPLPAIISILHRITGLILFFIIPIALCVLSRSLASDASFQSISEHFNHAWIKTFIWLALVALSYHLIAGLRHLLMDYGFGESLAAGRLSAKLVFIIVGLLILLIGVWIW